MSFTVDANGVVLGDAGGSAQPTASFSVARIGRGDTHAATSDGPSVRGQALVVERGVAQERLEMSPAGLEQSWSFAQRPAGRGDVEVRLTTAGMRVQGTEQGGLRFAFGEREVIYGAATWVDAHGVKTPVSTRYQAGQIVLTVPEHVVDASAYPAVLDPIISSRLIIATPARIAGGAPGGAALDCNATHCLVVWAQNGYPIARRIKRDGTPLDSTVIALSEAGQSNQAAGLTVTATPTDFLVSWSDHWSKAPGLQWVSVAAATGAVSDVPPKDLGVSADDYPTPTVSAYGNGVQLLVYRQAFPDNDIGLRLVDGVVQTPLAGIDLGPHLDYTPLGLAVGPNQFGYVQRGKLQRIASATGALLDAAPIEFSKFGYVNSPSGSTVVFDGANYVVVWFAAGKLQATRVRASDGVVLDPDDDFNELPGTRVLCAGTSNYLTASVADGKLFVIWAGLGGPVVSSFPLAPWTSSAADCSGASVSSFVAPDSALKLVGTSGMQALVGEKKLEALAFQVQANSSVTTQNTGTLNYHAGVGWPRVVSNGRDFMVSATHLVDGPSETLRTFVQPIDGATGERLSPQPTDVSALNDPLDFASTGTSYLIPEGNQARRLSCDGKLGAPATLFNGYTLKGLTADDAQYFAVVAPNSGQGLFGYRLDVDGRPIDAAPVKLIDDYLGYAVALGGNDEPIPSQRTFVALTKTQTGIAILRMRSGTGAALAPILVDTADHAYPNLVKTDGTNMVLGWNQQVPGADQDPWTALFDPTSGALTDKHKLPFARLGPVSFDGTSYVEVWQDPDATGYVRRLDTSFALIDPSAGTVMPTEGSEHDSNRFGRTLMVAAEYRAEELGTRLVGRFIDNELAPSNPSAAPVTCVPENVGGAGGEGGVGGEGGQTAGTAGTSSGGTGTAGTSTGGTATAGTSSVGGEAGASLGGEGSGGSEPQVGGAAGANEPGGSSGAPAGDGGEPSLGGTPSAGGTAASGSSTGGVAGSNSGQAGAGAGTSANAGSGAGGNSSPNAGSSGADAGSSGSAPPKTDSGCGCRVVSSSNGGGAPWTLAFGALALLRLRRRRSAAAG